MNRLPIVIMLAVAAATGITCGGGSDDDSPAGILDHSLEVMPSESFSYFPECEDCAEQYGIEFAPPDKMKLHGSGEGETWNYYLVAGDRWFVSSEGVRWFDGIDQNFPYLWLGDPRVMMHLSREPHLEAEENIGGEASHVVRSRLDTAEFIDAAETALDASDVPQEEVGSAAEFEEYLEGIGRGSAFRMWISKETLRVLRMEVEYPSVEGASSDPPTQTRTSSFDYETPVDVPPEPLSISHEEAERFRYISATGGGVVLQAASAYKAEHNVFPDQLDEGTLSAYLDPRAVVVNPISDERIELDEKGWPVNPFNEEPMRQTLTGTPGDFFYEITDGGQGYGICVYGWDGAHSVTGGIDCPEVQ